MVLHRPSLCWTVRSLRGQPYLPRPLIAAKRRVGCAGQAVPKIHGSSFLLADGDEQTISRTYFILTCMEVKRPLRHGRKRQQTVALAALLLFSTFTDAQYSCADISDQQGPTGYFDFSAIPVNDRIYLSGGNTVNNKKETDKRQEDDRICLLVSHSYKGNGQYVDAWSVKWTKRTMSYLDNTGQCTIQQRFHTAVQRRCGLWNSGRYYLRSSRWWWYRADGRCRALQYNLRNLECRT